LSSSKKQYISEKFAGSKGKIEISWQLPASSLVISDFGLRIEKGIEHGARSQESESRTQEKGNQDRIHLNFSLFHRVSVSPFLRVLASSPFA
jgi:hypothetical protein